MEKQIDVKIVSKETAFWESKKELSLKHVELMKEDLHNIPLLLLFHEAIIEMCKNKLEHEINNNKS